MPLPSDLVALKAMAGRLEIQINQVAIYDSTKDHVKRAATEAAAASIENQVQLYQSHVQYMQIAVQVAGSRRPNRASLRPAESGTNGSSDDRSAGAQTEENDRKTESSMTPSSSARKGFGLEASSQVASNYRTEVSPAKGIDESEHAWELVDLTNDSEENGNTGAQRQA